MKKLTLTAIAFALSGGALADGGPPAPTPGTTINPIINPIISPITNPIISPIIAPVVTNTNTNTNANANANANTNANTNTNNSAANAAATGGNAAATGGNAAANAAGGAGGAGGQGGAGGTGGVGYGGNVSDSGNVSSSGNVAGTATLTYNEAAQPSKIEVKSVPSAMAPALASAINNDLCVVSATAGGSGVGFGISIGLQYRDDDCVRRVNARQLFNFGYTKAAILLMAQDENVRKALQDAGDTLPPTVSPPQPAKLLPSTGLVVAQ